MLKFRKKEAENICLTNCIQDLKTSQIRHCNYILSLNNPC